MHHLQQLFVSTENSLKKNGPALQSKSKWKAFAWGAK